MPTDHIQHKATESYWSSGGRISGDDVVHAPSSLNRRPMWLAMVLIPTIVLAGVILATIIR
jgi:hypothetical protein